VADAGPALIPHMTYGEVLDNFDQYDIVLVPGGAYQFVELPGFLPNHDPFFGFPSVQVSTLPLTRSTHQS
jgi:hypothetical protein